MAESGRNTWDLAIVTESIHGVAQRYRLSQWEADAWRDAAWAAFLEQSARLAGQFRGRSSQRTYLGRFFERRCVDWLRRKKRRLLLASLPLDGAEQAAATFPTRAGGFVDPLIVAEEAAACERRARRVLVALRMLRRNDRYLVIAYCIKGLRMPEIANLLGCSSSAAHKRLRRALLKLRSAARC